MKKHVIIFLLALLCMSPYAQTSSRKLLQHSISFDALRNQLLYNQEWVDYPSYYDRASWKERVTPEMYAAVIAAGENALKHEWKPDLASDYLAYIRTGEIRTGRSNHMALQALTLAELLEGKGRFMDAIIDGTWFLCEVSWLHSAHLGFQKDRSNLPDPEEPTIELVVADIGAQMAWTYYFFHKEFDKVSPLINKRIKKEVTYRLIDPYFARDDYWWMGFTNARVNNWNVWINYNMIQALMLIETDKEKIVKGVWKLMRSTDAFIDTYKDDGACDEGPTYWGHAGANFLKCLDLFNKITAGNVNLFQNELVKNIGQYVYRAHIADSYFVNFADAAAVGSIKSAVVYEYGKRINDSQMMKFAGYFLKRSEWPENGPSGYLATALDEILLSNELANALQKEPLIGSHWFEGTEVCVARDIAGSKKGFFFAAKGGHNNESHNHNDVGSFVLYYDGKPLIIDAGVGVYTRQTFSSDRYKIWTMQSGFHNLPQINGVDQKNGTDYKAKNPKFKESRKAVAFEVDIADAYPAEAAVETWKRSYCLNRSKNFIIGDKWVLKEKKGNTYFNFMTCYEASILSPGKLQISANNNCFIINYNHKKVKPKIENIELTDKSLLRSWTSGMLYRIRFELLSDTERDENYFEIEKI